MSYKETTITLPNDDWERIILALGDRAGTLEERNDPQLAKVYADLSEDIAADLHNKNKSG
jgi:hypothetical protein